MKKTPSFTVSGEKQFITALDAARMAMRSTFDEYDKLEFVRNRRRISGHA